MRNNFWPKRPSEAQFLLRNSHALNQTKNCLTYESIERPLQSQTNLPAVDLFSYSELRGSVFLIKKGKLKFCKSGICVANFKPSLGMVQVWVAIFCAKNLRQTWTKTVLAANGAEIFKMYKVFEDQ